MLEAMSLFSACYALGGLGLMSILLDQCVSPWLYACAFSMAWHVYLLHRLRAVRRAGAPTTARSMMLQSHAGLVHVLLWCTGLASIGTAMIIDPWLLALLGASVMGMLLYGSGPDGGRVRDMLLIKNACVGISMCLFWLLLILPDSASLPEASLLLPVGMAVFLIVLGDAMYCDLCDVDADERTRSRTVPLRWGSGTTRWFADGSMLSAVLILAICSSAAGSRAVLAIIVLALFSQAALRLVGTPRVRMAVDVRLPLLFVLLWAGDGLVG